VHKLDPLPTPTTHHACCSLVDGGEREVRSLDLPHLHGVEPVVGLEATVKAVVGPRLVDDVRLEELGVLVKVLVFETSADLKRKNNYV
jgi:hypothetical protein